MCEILFNFLNWCLVLLKAFLVSAFVKINMFGARIKIMWEEQLVDPPIDYITYVLHMSTQYPCVVV